MGQYFPFAVNASKEEYVALPGFLKAVERFSNPVPMGILGYLLIEGPNDGTMLYRNAETDTADVREKVEEIKEREREHEKERERASSYRKRNKEGERAIGGPWDTDSLIRVALSYLEIKDTHDYAGRWAGDPVYLTGDYSNEEYYARCKTHTVVRLPNGEEGYVQGTREKVNPDGSELHSYPVKVKDIPYAEEAGDYIKVRSINQESLEEDTVCEVLRIEEPAYTDITDGVIEEFTALMGEEFMG